MRRRSIRTREGRRPVANLLLGICGRPRRWAPARRYGRPPVEALAGRQDLEALWEKVQAQMRASVPDSTYRLWLEPLKPAGAGGATLYLSAPEGVRAWA